MNQIDLAYAAGLIDGEGCFGLARERNGNGSLVYRPYVTVGMTTEEPIRWLHELFGVGGVTFFPKAPPARPMYRWRTQGKGARTVAEALLPYLRVKADVARLILAFYDDAVQPVGHGRIVGPEENARRAALKDEFHLLNAKGRHHAEMD